MQSKINMRNKVIFAIIFFFFIYDCYFKHFISTTNTYFSFIGIVLFIIYSPYLKKISKTDIYHILLFGIMLIWALIVMLYNGTRDYSFIRNELIREIFFPFFSAFFIALIGRNIIKSFYELLKLINILGSIQSILIILAFLFSEIKDWIISLQTIAERELAILDVGIRSIGLGIRFDYGAFTISVIMIFTCYLFINCENEKEKNYYIFSFFLQMIAGALLARSIIIGILFSCIYLLLIYKKWNRTLIFLFKILLLVLLLVICINLFFPELLIKYSKTLSWMFQYIFPDSSYQGGNTLNTLFTEMYFQPKEFKTWIMGDGLFQNSNGYAYMRTDALFMRYLLFWGIPGICIFIIFYKVNVLEVKKSYKNDFIKNNKFDINTFTLLFEILFFMYMIVYIKLNYHFIKYIFLFLWFLYFNRNKAYRR